MSEPLTIGVIAAVASLAGSLAGASIPTTLSWWLHRQQKNADVGYLAVTVGAILDRYIGGCIDVMYDDGVFDADGQLVARVSSPKLELGSLDVNWRSIPVTLLDRVFAIPNAQLLVQDRLAWEADFDDYPILVRQIEYGTLAETALRVVNALREHARLPVSPEGRLDYSGMIAKHMPKLVEKQQKIEQQQWTPIFQQNEAAPEGG
ncbi:hypothetical protein ABQZ69_02335 [Xanthomonas sp. WHRI 8391]|uniref:Uncharacterized protein n=1 Tax=Xanthomonas hortorum pv. carotae TaxID=487904 RepID=A0A6V7D1G3_9XANT|nr:hypothetical protein [Xanthomonas hortorum]MBG3849176.1 hypothetical protein [Xanthomonas hortorum pv. carotae]UTS72796.1 hypothetical protein NMB96_20565 [Xanthomonas hortorum]CAD0326505.1 hypothetical protein CFBP7900_16720 [Xanthomonas hortorum pv. carotae]CAD0326516.1 hypothetical protein CFBP7900_16720 [Xanthomonas hortorum pv. carotae]